MAQISSRRKLVFYAGRLITLVGLVFLLSIFFVGPFLLRTPSATELGGNGLTEVGRKTVDVILRGLIGFFLIPIGIAIASFAKAGIAGSGMVLDPDQAREDVRPWSEMEGKILDDKLSQVGIVKAMEKSLNAGQGAKEVVMVRCRACQALNDESAKFCDQCSQPL